ATDTSEPASRMRALGGHRSGSPPNALASASPMSDALVGGCRDWATRTISMAVLLSGPSTRAYATSRRSMPRSESSRMPTIWDGARPVQTAARPTTPTRSFMQRRSRLISSVRWSCVGPTSDHLRAYRAYRRSLVAMLEHEILRSQDRSMVALLSRSLASLYVILRGRRTGMRPGGRRAGGGGWEGGGRGFASDTIVPLACP